MSFNGLDVLWVVSCAGLVFIMQAGFLCLESGLTRSKNAINVAIKNVVDFAVSTGLYWLFGFALMFGASINGWIGSSFFMAATGPGTGGWFAAFFLFQTMFCSTSATIVSGAVAERMRFAAYLAVSAVIGGLIYPIFGHWAWGGSLEGQASGWLAWMGFRDFAGSSVVHSVGGWVALAAVLIMGPRQGRFDAAGGKPQELVAGNLPMAMLGTMLLFFGWFGFNGGSTLTLDHRVPGVLVNTVLGGVSGILAALWLGWRQRGYPDVVATLNGAISGLVAITAGANVVSPASAVLIGAVGAIVMIFAERWLLRLQIDDAVGAIPVHLAAGAWGTIAVGLFGNPDLLGTGLGWWAQVAVQLLGVVVCGLWSFGVAYLVLRGIDRLLPLRVDAKAEEIGLNISEHGARTELNDLLRVMEEQERGGDISLRVPAQPFSEVGQIASSYNRLLDSLERAMEQTRAVIRDVRDGIITYGCDGVLLSLNPGAEKLFGIAAPAAVGQPLASLFERGLNPPRGGVAELLRAGGKHELRLARSGQPIRVLELSVSATQVGEQALLTGLVRDVTERRQMEEQLQRERDLAQVTLASIGDGVITTDEAGVIQYLNPMAERLTGWSGEEARGRNIAQVYRLESELNGEALENPVRAVLARGLPQRNGEHGLLVRKDEQRVPVQDTAAPIRNRKGYLIGVVLVFHDVTLTLQLTRELSHQAAHDALTGVANRREFERRLQELLTHPGRGDGHVLCYLDLDQFKVVNDTCGHVAGDELLRQVTALLRERVRQSDALARLGGDEFGVLFHDCSVERAAVIADDFRQTIQDFRFSWEGKSFAIGVSIGLVEIAPGEADIPRLFAAADAACYSAKESGRNRVHVYRPDDDQILERHGQMQWVTRLRAALDGDRLRLHVQPIISLHGASQPHYEVLVRLEEAGRLIAPGSFLPAAERYGLMPEIDEWIFCNVMAWLGDNHRRNGRAPGTFSINLSGASLSDERLRRKVGETLKRAALPPGTVCIEITESSAVANLSKVVEFIGEVKALGCGFALDDFGSGLSSFAYLKSLPVDYLKIDGSFVRGIADDATDYAMVQAINTIGHTMGLVTIAEFVETEAVRDALTEIGVDYAQGYLFGRPQPLEELGQVRVMPR